MSGHESTETDAEFDARYEAYFNRADIDGWEYRKAMGDLAGMDLVPEPAIVNAALRACRRLNDYALATRTLEVIKMKCAGNEAVLWPYMLQVNIMISKTFKIGFIHYTKMFFPLFIILNELLLIFRKSNQPWTNWESYRYRRWGMTNQNLLCQIHLRFMVNPMNYRSLGRKRKKKT